MPANIQNVGTICSVGALRGGGSDGTIYFLPLLSDLVVSKGIGAVTYTRNSTLYEPNASGIDVSYSANTPAFSATGLGIVSSAAVTNKVTAYSVPRADSLGAELVSDPTLDNTSNWSIIDTGWAITAGVATSTASGSNTGIYPKTTGGGQLTVAVGKVYSVTYTVDSISSGSVKFYANTSTSTARTSAGTYTELIYITASLAASTACGFIAGSANTSLVISSVSIKEAIDYPGTKAYHNGTSFQNPITNMTLSGDTAAVLSIVTDSAALTTALADSTLQMRGAIQAAIDNGGKVYKVVTGAGGSADTDFSGAMSAVTTSDYILYRVAAGSMVLSDNSNANATASLTSATWAMATKENFTATAARLLRVRTAASSTIYFLAPHLTETPYVPQSPYIPTSGAASTRAATVTSTSYTLSATGTRHIKLTWTPKATAVGTKQVLWSSYTNASNETSVWANGVILAFEKKVAGVSEYVTYDLTPVVGTQYTIDAYIYADNTMGLGVNGVMQTGTLGSELITVAANRDFSSDTGFWTKNSATINNAGNGIAVLNGLNSSLVRYVLSGATNKIIGCSWEVIAYTSGTSSASAYAGSYNTTNLFSGTGVFFGAVNYGNDAANQLRIGSAAGVTFIGSIDNVSAKLVYNNSTTLAPVFGSTIQWGSSNSLVQAEGFIKNISILNR